LYKESNEDEEEKPGEEEAMPWRLSFIFIFDEAGINDVSSSYNPLEYAPF